MILALLASCASSAKESVRAYPRLEPAELGAMRNVSVSEGIWFGSVPNAEDLDLARRRGIERVVDLRPTSQIDAPPGGFEPAPCPVGEACQELELEWTVPGLPDDPTTTRASLVDCVLDSLDGDAPRVLLYCADGSTCALFFAIHRVVNQGVDLESALLEARRAGVQGAAGEEFIRREVARLEGPAGAQR